MNKNTYIRDYEYNTVLNLVQYINIKAVHIGKAVILYSRYQQTIIF